MKTFDFETYSDAHVAICGDCLRNGNKLHPRCQKYVLEAWRHFKRKELDMSIDTTPVIVDNGPKLPPAPEPGLLSMKATKPEYLSFGPEALRLVLRGLKRAKADNKHRLRTASESSKVKLEDEIQRMDILIRETERFLRDGD